MFIQNQLRDSLYNSDNLTKVFCRNGEIGAYTADGHICTLARYSSEETAQEVFSKFMNAAMSGKKAWRFVQSNDVAFANRKTADKSDQSEWEQQKYKQSLGIYR